MKTKTMVVALLPLFFLSIVQATASKSDEKFINFDRKIEIKGGGVLRLSYEYFGEPVNAPANLTIHVSCNKKSREIEVATLPMCEIKNYRYEKDVSVLTIEYVFSRVDAGGQVHCDQKDEKQYNIRKICRSAAKNKKR